MSTEAKELLRAQLKQERKAADQTKLIACDAAIANATKDQDAYKDAPLVLTYLSFGREVDTRLLIESAWEQGKRVALPKCQPGGLMSWHVVDSLEGLVTSSFGMDEPDESQHPVVDVAALGSEAIALVPGLAFDEAGYRLGYGGGFYDRFLANFPGTSIGLCRPANFYESLRSLEVVDSFDMPVDIVVTGTE